MKIFLKKKIAEKISKGHQWIFRFQVGDTVGDYIAGEEVLVHSSNGSFIGKGLLSGTNNSIIARIYSLENSTVFDNNFWEDRIQNAIQWRMPLKGTHQFFRWINGDIDNLSGLIVDEMGSNIIITCQSVGIDNRKEIFKQILIKKFPDKNVIFDDENYIRKNDELIIQPIIDFVPLEYVEQGIKIKINHPNDYKIDRILIKKMVRSVVGKNAIVWDLCCGNGGLGLNAFGSGASQVIFVDNNQLMIDGLEKTILNNNLNLKCKYLNQNVFQFLKNKDNLTPNVIIIDTPNFNPNANEELMKPYEDLARLSFKKLVGLGGFLIYVFNNSKIGFYEAEKMFQNVTQELKIPFNLLQTVVTPPDFGINLSYSHTNYLKAFLIQVPQINQ